MPGSLVRSGVRLLAVVVGLALVGVGLVLGAVAVFGDRAPALPTAEVIEEWSCEVPEAVSVSTRSFVFPVDDTDPATCQITTAVSEALTSPTTFLCLLDPDVEIVAAEARVWLRPLSLLPGRSERCRFTTSDGEQVDVWNLSPTETPTLDPGW